ncbi:cation-translocating P-type ATPase [Halanaeroarchaeum sulfurireducens]
MVSETERGGETREWHELPVDRVLDALDTEEAGLSSSAAATRRETFGPNDIRREDTISPAEIFLSQFQDVLIYVLLVAALLSLAIGVLPGEGPNYVDALLILLILLGNGVFGFVQDYRAETAMEELRELASPEATILRDGERRVVDATEVVPGDVVVLEQGDSVPADARLIEATNLETNESTLTGESAAVTKGTDPVEAGTPLAERSNMVYMNTNAVRGRGKAVVVETGMNTEVGGIATQIQEAEDDRTPFQDEVDELGRRIGYGVLALIVLVVGVQLLFTQANWIVVVLTAVTLAVAAVPEGLPAVVTLTLALGSKRLVGKKALVRRLSVVESLGSVDTIVTDKTGTLTENQMTVRRITTGAKTYKVTGSGLDTDGDIHRNGERVDPATTAPVLRCGAYCNNAERAPESEDEAYYGDPTEVALLVAAEKAGIDRDASRVREVPFSADRKRMTVVVEASDDPIAYMKGAPETVLERCDRVLLEGEAVPLTDERREAIRERTEAFAADALRVLAFARKTVTDPSVDDAELEQGLVFLGLQGMIDPPRVGVDTAVTDCRDAGIRVVMATGDNLDTATAIGSQIGFDPDGAMTGADVDASSDADLRDAVESVEVFARVAPHHKVQILRALQSNDHRVAMTGDGVNDAPGVRTADVGISMGQRGTDVTKEASDLVLQDDNFLTIRDAVAEGRAIFDNIRKFVNLLLSANAGEVLTVFVGVLIGSLLFPERFAAHSNALILTPVMLLWINLVTDGLPALALGVDPKAPDILDRGPRASTESVIDKRVVVSILTIGTTLTVAGLAIFFETLATVESLIVAQTALFTFFVVSEMGIIQVIRRRFGNGPFSNRWLIAAVVGSLGLQALVLYTPVADLFDVYPVGRPIGMHILLAVGAVLLVNYALSVAYDRL